MGLLTQAKDVTFHLFRHVGDGGGGITEDAFYESYQKFRNNKEKLKEKLISVHEAKAIVNKAEQLGFIRYTESNNAGAKEFKITAAGYDLIHSVWKIPTGLCKTYINRYNYLPIVVSLCALIASVYAAFIKN